MGLRIRLACLVLIGLILPFRAFSSDQDLETGKKLHDAGDYDGAIRIYRQVLKDKYGEPLRLHCYSVVSLGFERLVWTEVL